jgi:hypothetical protein
MVHSIGISCGLLEIGQEREPIGGVRARLGHRLAQRVGGLEGARLRSIRAYGLYRREGAKLESSFVVRTSGALKSG